MSPYFQDVRPMTSVPVVPGWAETTAAWGRTNEVPAAPPGGYRPMSPPPWAGRPRAERATAPLGHVTPIEQLTVQNGWNGGGHREDKHIPSLVWAVLIGVVVALIAILGFVVQRQNLLPAAVPFIGKDSGVAVCEVMAKGNGPTGTKKAAGATWTADEYREVRAVFADSRYPGIRDNGLRMIDLVWQIQGLGEDEALGALAFVGSMADAYAGLAGGCADVGYVIPALGKA